MQNVCVLMPQYRKSKEFTKAKRDNAFLSTYLAAFASFENFLFKIWKHCIRV